jgi:hypothetical protein
VKLNKSEAFRENKHSFHDQANSRGTIAKTLTGEGGGPGGAANQFFLTYVFGQKQHILHYIQGFLQASRQRYYLDERYLSDSAKKLEKDKSTALDIQREWLYGEDST